jgi:hypothetical protein
MREKYNVYQLNGRHPKLNKDVPFIVIGSMLFIPKEFDYALTTQKTHKATKRLCKTVNEKIPQI